MVVFGLLATAALFLPGVVVPMFAGSAEDETVAAVLAAEQAREAALLAADTHALGKLLADDLRYTHSDGNLETKAIHIATITNGLRYARFTTANVVGHVITPEVVVLTGVLDQRKGYGEKWKDAHLMFHAVWRKKSGAWQLASLQTAAPPAANH
jgi:hypothetical protein